MTDIVERLRAETRREELCDLSEEAADEIERLREQLAKAIEGFQKIDKLSVCNLASEVAEEFLASLPRDNDETRSRNSIG